MLKNIRHKEMVNMSEYYCPNCGADLDDQPGFDPNAGYWTCTSCGQFLIDPADGNDVSSRFKDVGWFCDGCGAYLNKQFGFSDWNSTWQCTECGYINNISEDEIYESEAAYQASRNESEEYSYDYDEDEDEDEDDEDYGEDDADEDYNEEDSSVVSSCPIADALYSKKEKRQARKKHFWHNLTGEKQEIGLSSGQCHSMHFANVLRSLQNNEFYNISVFSADDLSCDDVSLDGLIYKITVNGKDLFSETDQFPYNANIKIYYHTVKRAHPPFIYSEVKKKNLNDVVRQFEAAGFRNIHRVAIPDLINGWLKKDLSVEDVTIKGNKNFLKFELYRVDSEILITYHTFKKKKK